MRLLKPSIGLAVFLACSTLVNGQRIDSVLNVLAINYPAEKVYIHYDKDAYIAGETIWFKAYFSSDGLPSGMSSSFYVELSDDKGRIVTNKIYPVLGATVRGNIDLPDSLPQGTYYLKGTTPAIANYGNEFIYRKDIIVFNPTSKNPGYPVTPDQTISIQFFPESGNLVDGILTVVAFKATDKYGNPVDVSGVIRTDEGTAVCSFKSYHDGIGKFQFKPQAGKKYKAEVEAKDKVNTYPLPQVEATGINLKIQDEKGGKMFLLAKPEKDKSLFSSVTLIAEMNKRIVYENTVEFDNYSSVKGHLLTDSLPSGILHFTVFNKDGLPVAERLTFVNNKEYIGKAELQLGKAEFGQKAANSLEINFPEAIQRSLSVAITDGSVPGAIDKENIWSAFLLTGDLKGEIHNPAYYFEQQGDSVTQALDNLMLTHGWSRYEWKKILSRDFPVYKYKDGNYLSVNGVVYDEQDKGAVQGGFLNIYLESGDSTSRNYEVPVAKDGKFIIDSAVYFGDSKFYYTYTTSQGKVRPVKIHLDKQPINFPYQALFGELKNDRFIAMPASKQVAEQYDWLKKDKSSVKVLEPVVVESKSSKKPIDQVNDKYTTGVFRAMGKVNLDNVTQPANDKSGNALDFIKNRIQQVELQGGKFVSRKNFSLNSGQKWAVDVFIDESPANPAQLRNMRVDEIALVKYFEAGFVGVGSSSPGGAIAVYTKRGDKPQQPIDKLEFFSSQGYSITREFYKPDYSKADLKSQMPDKRITLYWDPNVFTDSETTSVKVNFFNNDVGRKFKVVIEGFDVNGKLVHLEKWIE